ncbi:ABC transporter ATP-binding protein [Cyanobium sp. N5-Cardenillas]|uniref:ABC transporter ATP-binding protein n=1 Tax=Cyanobium sp. N5-Cardenillas TaxID=2823720 RepID=UPI0020CB6E9B|nr:ABC transporter ATP-binding protein [Cyanobium sp. N5-Cardenillas]MCP9784652.1 ABC transporter ATP-binding protein [Cyanobium sp. N5-Cardenillas]
MSTSSAAGLELRQLCRKVGDRRLLDGLDLQVAPGECVALLGPSGCGKSTTLRLVAGLDPASGGQVLLDGVDLTGRSPGERQVAMVFQSYALYPHLSVEGNLDLGLKVRGLPPRERQQRIDATLELLQLGELRQRRPAQLSGGQRQRVALARALLRHPRIVLLDEPMSNLDAQLREDLRPELRRLLCGREQPVIYVTHDQQEAVGMADRIALLEAGRLQQVGSPRELYTNPANRFVASFLGRPAINLLAVEPGRQLGLRPEHIHLGGDGTVAARLLRREWWGHQQLLWLQTHWGAVRVLTGPEAPPPPEPRLSWQRQHELWFDPDSGARLPP